MVRINVGTYKFVIVIAISVFQVNSPVTESNAHLSDMDISQHYLNNFSLFSTCSPFNITEKFVL